jgi:hypothetical protein
MKFSLILVLSLFLTPVAANATSMSWYWGGQSSTDQESSQIQLFAKDILENIRVRIDEQLKLEETNYRYSYLRKFFEHIEAIHIQPRPWPQDEEGSSPVPEPTAALLFGVGAAIVGGGLRRSRKA